jgi:hypothetical protein
VVSQHGTYRRLTRNPFHERGVFSLDLRVTKGLEWWKEHGNFLFGIGIHNLSNRTSALSVRLFTLPPPTATSSKSSMHAKPSSVANGSRHGLLFREVGFKENGRAVVQQDFYIFGR